MTGSTSTSIWSHYAAGAREYCGHALPEGLKKSQRLPATIVTPTTKEEAHDRPISGAEVVALGLATADEWAYIEAKALALFAFGEAVARERGLILVDTKYEFGRDVETGEVMVIDEMHTPDSSRYWLADSYAARVAAGAEPDNVDKEFLRLWFRAHCDPYADARLPPAPRELVAELSARYTKLYELITGETFVPPPGSVGEGGERAAAGAAGGAGVEAAVAAALGDALPRAAAALVVVDTDGEPRTAADAAAAGAAAGVASEYHAGSVVTASARLIELYAALGARPAAAGASAGAGAGARAAAAPVFAVAVTGGAWAAATAAHAAALFRGPVLLVGPPAAAAEAGGRVRAVGSLADAVAAAAEAAAAAPATTAPAAAAPAAT